MNLCYNRIASISSRWVRRCTSTFQEQKWHELLNQGITPRCQATRARVGPVEAFCLPVLPFNAFNVVVLGNILPAVRESVLT